MDWLPISEPSIPGRWYQIGIPNRAFERPSTVAFPFGGYVFDMALPPAMWTHKREIVANSPLTT